MDDFWLLHIFIMIFLTVGWRFACIFSPYLFRYLLFFLFSIASSLPFGQYHRFCYEFGGDPDPHEKKGSSCGYGFIFNIDLFYSNKDRINERKVYM